MRREAPSARVDTSGAHERWKSKAAELRASPGEWFRIVKHDPTEMVASNIRRGHLRAFKPKGAYEAATRTENGKRRVFARYVGEDGQHA